MFKISKFTSPNRTFSKHTVADVAIRTLAMRMIFYPIAQAIARSGYSWYEFAYGSYRTIDDATPNDKKGCLLYMSIVTPAAPVAYLIILCVMQPRAYLHFKSLFCCRSYEEVEKAYVESRTIANARSKLNSVELTDQLEAQIAMKSGQDHFPPSRTVSSPSGGRGTLLRSWLSFSWRPNPSQPQESTVTKFSEDSSRPSTATAGMSVERESDKSNDTLESTGSKVPAYTLRHSVQRKLSSEPTQSEIERPSDRFTEEVLRYTQHGHIAGGSLSLGDWNAVLRLSMQQTDEDLIAMIAEADLLIDNVIPGVGNVEIVTNSKNNAESGSVVRQSIQERTAMDNENINNGKDAGEVVEMIEVKNILLHK